jgi:hypothetical protein
MAMVARAIILMVLALLMLALMVMAVRIAMALLALGLMAALMVPLLVPVCWRGRGASLASHVATLRWACGAQCRAKRCRLLCCPLPRQCQTWGLLLLLLLLLHLLLLLLLLLLRLLLLLLPLLLPLLLLLLPLLLLHRRHPHCLLQMMLWDQTPSRG